MCWRTQNSQGDSRSGKKLVKTLFSWNRPPSFVLKSWWQRALAGCVDCWTLCLTPISLWCSHSDESKKMVRVSFLKITLLIDMPAFADSGKSSHRFESSRVQRESFTCVFLLDLHPLCIRAGDKGSWIDVLKNTKMAGRFPRRATEIILRVWSSFIWNATILEDKTLCLWFATMGTIWEGLCYGLRLWGPMTWQPLIVCGCVYTTLKRKGLKWWIRELPTLNILFANPLMYDWNCGRLYAKGLLLGMSKIQNSKAVLQLYRNAYGINWISL